MLLVGHPEAIQDTKEKIKVIFKIEEEESLEDYLGVRIVKSEDGRNAWLRQPTIIKSLREKFGDNWRIEIH